MAVKLSIDEDILSIKSSPGLLERIWFFKHWTYAFELPVNRISHIEIESRLGVRTMVVHKMCKEGHNRHIPVSINKASNSQVAFIEKALPKIVVEKLTMPEIKGLKNMYLKRQGMAFS